MPESRRKALVVVLSILTVALLAGASAASVAIRNARAAQAQQDEVEGEGVHGGTVQRYHESDCDLVDTSDLEGNWTHGDYVSAVEAADPTKVREAAHSRCGKPAHAGRGGPGNARAAEAKAKAKAAKEAREATR